MTPAKTQEAPLLRRLRELPQPAWVICIGMFVSKLGNFLNVFLILYLTHRGYSTFFAGTALGLVGLGSFAGNAVGGTVADRIGRRAAIAVSMFGSALFTLLVPVCPSAFEIVALAVAIGFFGQLYRPAGGAILVDTVTPAQRVTAFGLLRLAINLGMSIGPVIGGVLSGVDYTYLFVGDAVTNAVFGILVLVLLAETKPQARPDGGSEQAGRAPSEGYRRVVADRAMVFYLLAVFAVTYVYTQTTATLPLHVHDLHLSNSFFGLLLSINAIMCVCVELPLIKITGSLRPGPVLAVGMALTGVGVGLTGAADGRIFLVLTVVTWSLGEMVYTPVATTYPGLLAPEHLRGRYQGAEGIAITAAQAVGPALGGLAYSVGQTVHWLSCGAVAAAGAVIILFCPDPRKRAAQAQAAEPVGQLDASLAAEA